VGLFSRSGGAKVVVSPTNVAPRQTVTATVTTDKAIDEVRSARLDWGYSNFYQYHWAGRVDFRGSARQRHHLDDGSGWHQLRRGPRHRRLGERHRRGHSDRRQRVHRRVVDVQIPSWAPASSPSIARWECRLTVDRGGRDIDTNGEFTVVIGTADVEAYEEPLEVVSGAAETIIDIALSSPVHRAGETITGQVTLTPTMDLPDGDLAVSWQRDRESHPLTRAPGPGTELDGPIVTLASEFRYGQASRWCCRSRFPFRRTPRQRPRPCTRRSTGSSRPG